MVCEVAAINATRSGYKYGNEDRRYRERVGTTPSGWCSWRKHYIGLYSKGCRVQEKGFEMQD